MAENGFHIRPGTEEDVEFLREMAALFGQGHDESKALKDWPQVGWDHLLVLEHGEGNRVGAAWWRAFTAVRSGDLDPTVREPFLGVDPPARDAKNGRRLLDALIADARDYPGIERLIARVVPDRREVLEPMLRRRGFVANHNFVSRGLGTFWVLWVSDQESDIAGR